MQEFKVGDLVNVQSNSNKTLANIGRAVNFIGKIVAIHQYNGICVHPLDRNPIEADWYSPEELSTWQPKQGEWCWFWNKRLVQELRLSQFSNVFNDTYYTHTGNDFDHCEPFIGELPSFLKEK